MDQVTINQSQSRSLNQKQVSRIDIMSVSIIAEIGSNFAKFEDPHENLLCAYEQVYAAKECGATAVKFQYFTPEELFGQNLNEEKADKLASFVPRRSDIKLIAEMCMDIDIEFMCSSFSPLGFEYVNRYVDRHKLASPELSDPHLRRFLSSCGKPVIYSLGCQAGPIPEMDLGPEDILLECVSNYPARFMDYDIHRMIGLPNWGVSDHTLDHNLAVYCRSLGATFFEKHVDFFYGEGRDTPDNCVSISAEEFVAYVHAINSMEPINRNLVKYEAAEKYARRKIEGEWKRPKPEGW